MSNLICLLIDLLFLSSFKRGLYLAQAVQVAYCLGLVVAVAICVRERIWMRESRNSMVRVLSSEHSELNRLFFTIYAELLFFIESSLIFFHV